jgi:Ferritin-like
MPWTLSAGASRPREPSQKSTDASALRAIAQAAINVELFTIPLYMGSLYSLKGMHQITGKGESFYKGRLWPGAAASAQPNSGNERAFNIIFSVFIQEMLHLQMAANIAGAIGLSPNFTSLALQNENHGWTCFGPDRTIIPHIVDLRDLDAPYGGLKVDIAALSKEQIELFLVIEQPEKDARRHIVKGKYFPTVPFDGWEFYYTEKNLPLFGTIGYMYQCYYDYLNIKYKDGTSLWQYVTVSANQRDLFNVVTASHPEREYPHFDASLSSLKVVVDMMDAITDQGEGSTLVKSQLAAAVEERYRSSEQALKADYPSYTDGGASAPSAEAAARYGNDAKDHFERFQEVQTLLERGEIETWADWFAAGNKWKKEDLEAPDYQPDGNPALPTTETIAQALNNLALPAVRAATHTLMSKVAAGAIAGVTTVLNQYWKSQEPGKPVAFPSPSMGGAGDRMAICWALFGEPPDLSLGTDPIDGSKLYHACQALDLAAASANQCADPAVFHTCIGSNQCKSQGGCGFVQQTSGGGICGHAMGARGPLSAGEVPASADTVYSAPSDNKCGAFGGCAVPISASQIYPKSGKMQLFDFSEDDKHTPKAIAVIEFAKGEPVHAVAYRAYTRVMQHRHKEPPAQPPPPSDVRLAFPPST